MTRTRTVSRREFARATAAGLGAGLLTSAAEVAAQTPASRDGRPETLRSEFLLDLVLETRPSVSLGARTIVEVSGGTFEGPRLRGRVLSPGADWPLAVRPDLRILDVRLLLVTDDEQRIYMTYRGLIHTPPAGQGERYWRTTPIFETDSKKYEWLTQAVFVGVSFQVPQRVSYRVFQIL